jgi:hypothetical protein
MEALPARPLVLDLEVDPANHVPTAELLFSIHAVARQLAQEEYERGPGSRPDQRVHMSLPEGHADRRKAKKLESAYRSRFHQRVYPEVLRAHVEAAQRRKAKLESLHERLLQEREMLSVEVVRAEDRKLKQKLGRLLPANGRSSSRGGADANNGPYGGVEDAAGGELRSDSQPSDPRSRRRQIISEYTMRFEDPEPEPGPERPRMAFLASGQDEGYGATVAPEEAVEVLHNVEDLTDYDTEGVYGHGGDLDWEAEAGALIPDDVVEAEMVATARKPRASQSYLVHHWTRWSPDQIALLLCLMALVAALVAVLLASH